MTMQNAPLSLRPLALLFCAGLALAGCGYAKPNPTPINTMGIGTNGEDGRLGGEDSGILLGIDKDRGVFGGSGKGNSGGGGPGMAVNAYLWRGALDTLGFMPLNSIDPFGGVIITDWYTPAASNGGERFKATAFILTKDLRSDGVRVSVFRQVLQGGQWVDSGVAETTIAELENKVLARARKLREQAQGNS